MTNWIWKIINEMQLAEFVTPMRTLEALGGRPSTRQSNHDMLTRHEYKNILAAIYGHLLGYNVNYAHEPFHYEAAKEQRIRTPETVIGSDTMPGEGTCLDLALLLAGLCLERKLRPIVVVFKGHALVLVSVVDSTEATNPQGKGLFASGSCRDYSELVGLTTNNRFVAVECTGFAVSVTASGRDAAGQVDFTTACDLGTAVIDGTSAIGGQANFRFAIEPQQLFMAGIKPRESPPTIDDRLREFQLSSQRAGDAIDAIANALPAQLAIAPGPELDQLRDALSEVLKTYDIVHLATSSWLRMAISDDLDEAKSFLVSMSTGQLEVEIDQQRGHCGKIGDLYYGGAQDFLARQLNDNDAMTSIDRAFDHLISSDDDFFRQAGLVGEYLTEISTSAYESVLDHDDDAARQTMRDSAREVGTLQRAIGGNRRDLYQLGLALFGSLDAIGATGAVLPSNLDSPSIVAGAGAVVVSDVTNSTVIINSNG